jgi:RNA polymerase sigma-70 factor (ECF subfamily)
MADGTTAARVDEAVLLAALRSGDESAFTRLVSDWSPAMLRVARGYVASWQAAEDAVQDAWLGVVHGLDRFEGRSSLRTWVFTILTNRARTRGVRDKRTVPWSQLTDGAEPPEVDPGRFQGSDGEYPGHWSTLGAPVPWDERPEGSALSHEAFGLLGEALQDLPERQRIVVTLRDVHGLASEEVCAVLEISPENQRVLLHRGRSRLRAALEGYYRG